LGKVLQDHGGDRRRAISGETEKDGEEGWGVGGIRGGALEDGGVRDGDREEDKELGLL